MKKEQFIDNLFKIFIIFGIIFLFFANVMRAQSGVYLQASLDPKMMIKGDPDREIQKGTLDASFRLIMESNQQKHGYIIVFPEFTYSDMPGNLKSYTANFGYTFNTFIPKSEIGLTAGWGWLDRYGITTFSFVTTQSYALKVSDKFKLVIVSEFRDRTDLAYLYGDGKIGWSLRGGVEVKLF